MWGVDITYIRLRFGWIYLFAVLDWYSRFVVDLSNLRRRITHSIKQKSIFLAR
jgi:transposase InsO family protein